MCQQGYTIDSERIECNESTDVDVRMRTANVRFRTSVSNLARIR